MLLWQAGSRMRPRSILLPKATMSRALNSSLRSLLGVLCVVPVMTQAAEPVPAAHCRKEETTLFSSRMGTSVWNDMRTRKTLKGEKYLALCADRFPLPKRVDVRFGKAGALDLDHSSPTAKYRLSTQALDGGVTWNILSFDTAAGTWSVVEPQGGDARDVFLVLSRNGLPLLRTEAIEENDHWLHFKKKVGKKKSYDVALSLTDLPPVIAVRTKDALDPALVERAKYVPNLAAPKPARD